MQVKNDIVNSIDKLNSRSSSKKAKDSSNDSDVKFNDYVKDVKEQSVESKNSTKNEQPVNSEKASDSKTSDTHLEEEKINLSLTKDVNNDESKDKSKNLEDNLFQLLSMFINKGIKVESVDEFKEKKNLKNANELTEVESSKTNASIEKILQQINGVSVLHNVNVVADFSKLVDVSNDKQLRSNEESGLMSIIKDFASKNGLKLNDADLKDMSKMLQDLSKSVGSNADFIKILKSLENLELNDDSFSKIIDKVKDNTSVSIEKPIDSSKGNVLTSIDKPVDSIKENIQSVSSKQKDSNFNNAESNNEKSSLEVNGNTLKGKNTETKSNDFINIMQQNTSDKEISSVEAKEIANIRKPQDIIDITVTKFKALRLPEITEVNVKLKPEQLGEISVKLVLEKGQINGQISAETKEVANILQNGMDNLKEQLKNSNVNLNNVSVNISSDDNSDNRHNRGQFNGQNKNNNRNFEEIFADSIEQEEDSGVNIIA